MPHAVLCASHTSAKGLIFLRVVVRVALRVRVALQVRVALRVVALRVEERCGEY